MPISNVRTYKVPSSGTGNLQLPTTALDATGLIVTYTIACPGVKVGECVRVHSPSTGPVSTNGTAGNLGIVGNAWVSALDTVKFNALSMTTNPLTVLNPPTASDPWRVVVTSP